MLCRGRTDPSRNRGCAVVTTGDGESLCYNAPMFARPFTSRLIPITLLSFAALVFVLAAGCIAGNGEPTIPEAAQDLPPELARVVEAYRILLDEHVDHRTLTSEQMSDGAIRGLLTALNDPHASYLSAEQYASEQEGYRGFFEGIGAQVTLTEAGLTVIAPIPGAPAEAAGILPGDLILEVDGENIEGLTLVEAVNLIRGPGGTEVILLVHHVGSNENVSITVTRGRIPIDSVAFKMLGNGVGHLWVYGFSNTTENEVRAALDEFAAANGTALVLDLRNNPGGLLHVVISVADLFLDGGSVLYEVDAAGDRTDYDSNRRGPGVDIPMVVMVNQFSASASEILAGAIKTNDRALVVGATTFGKGSVNITRLLSDGSAIYFSIRRWYLPDGTQIEGQGVTPNIEIVSDVLQLPIDLADDPALQEAIVILNSRVMSQ